MVFVLTGCNGDSCLVTPKDNGYENSSMRINVYGNELLFMSRLAGVGVLHGYTYTLVPSPVSRHEVTVSPFSVHKITVWDIVDGIN